MRCGFKISTCGADLALREATIQLCQLQGVERSLIGDNDMWGASSHARQSDKAASGHVGKCFLVANE